MTVGTGIIAGLLAPLLEAVGFLEWDIQWTNSGGSAFALNLYKCNLAALAFLYMAFWMEEDGDVRRKLTDLRPYFADQYLMDQELLNRQIHTEDNIRYQQHLEQQQIHFQQYHEYPEYVRNSRMDGYPVFVIGNLVLSSLLGVVIGDLAELEALRLVGARRVLVVDTVKPFAAAFLGQVILGETIYPIACLGMIFTAAGIYVVLMATLQKLDKKTKLSSHGSSSSSPRSNRSSDDGSFLLIEGQEDLISLDDKSLGLMQRPIRKHSFDSLRSLDDISYFDADDDFSVASGLSERSSNSSEDFFIENDTSHHETFIRSRSSESSSSPRDHDKEHFPVTTLKRTNSFGSQASFISFESECGPPPGYYQNANHREKKRDRIKRLRRGYAFALVNVLLDAYAALLTKQYGAQLSTWEINFVRYGFAGFLLSTVSAFYRLNDKIFGSDKVRIKFGKTPSIQVHELHESEQSPPVPNTPWYRLPSMHIQSWITISLGVVFVTFLCPALSNYALFEVPLALAVTLISTTPLYMLPLMVVVKNEMPTKKGALGALLACLGVCVLCIWGIDAENVG